MRFLTSLKPAPTVVTEQPPSDFDSANAKNTRALVVEDNGNDTLLATHVLEASGIREWHSVKTAEEALKFISQRACQIALVDYNLPGMNGLELINVLHEEAPQMRVILVTGVRDEKIAVAVMKAGAFDYVSKDDYLTTGIQESIRAALLDIKAGRKEQLPVDSGVDEAMIEADWLLEPEGMSYGASAYPSMSARTSYPRALAATERYLRSSCLEFPARARVEETTLLEILLEQNVAPRDIVLIWRDALQSVREEVLPFNPTLLLADLLKTLLEEHHATIAV